MMETPVEYQKILSLETRLRLHLSSFIWETQNGDGGACHNCGGTGMMYAGSGEFSNDDCGCEDYYLSTIDEYMAALKPITDQRDDKWRDQVAIDMWKEKRDLQQTLAFAPYRRDVPRYGGNRLNDVIAQTRHEVPGEPRRQVQVSGMVASRSIFGWGETRECHISLQHGECGMLSVTFRETTFGTDFFDTFTKSMDINDSLCIVGHTECRFPDEANPRRQFIADALNSANKWHIRGIDMGPNL